MTRDELLDRLATILEWPIDLGTALTERARTAALDIQGADGYPGEFLDSHDDRIAWLTRTLADEGPPIIRDGRGRIIGPIPVVSAGEDGGPVRLRCRTCGQEVDGPHDDCPGMIQPGHFVDSTNGVHSIPHVRADQCEHTVGAWDDDGLWRCVSCDQTIDPETGAELPHYTHAPLSCEDLRYERGFLPTREATDAEVEAHLEAEAP